MSEFLAPNDSPRALHEELRRRMARPQRHRLLQGYPMAPLMRPLAEHDGYPPILGDVIGSPERPIIVGVLPHTFCNPRVRGCGFCTFPHEKLDNEALRRVVAHVTHEIDDLAPWVDDRRVDAIYFGGGTANLTPPDALRALCVALGSHVDIAGSELTLEG